MTKNNMVNFQEVLVANIETAGEAVSAKCKNAAYQFKSETTLANVVKEMGLDLSYAVYLLKRAGVLNKAGDFGPYLIFHKAAQNVAIKVEINQQLNKSKKINLRLLSSEGADYVRAILKDGIFFQLFNN